MVYGTMVSIALNGEILMMSIAVVLTLIDSVVRKLTVAIRTVINSKATSEYKYFNITKGNVAQILFHKTDINVFFCFSVGILIGILLGLMLLIFLVVVIVCYFCKCCFFSKRRKRPHGCGKYL